MTLRRSLTVAAAVIAASALALVAPLSASAATGVGDVSAAVVYGASGPVGDVLTALKGQDDSATTVALPFPITYNGVEANALCVVTNGYVVPVPTAADGCNTGAYDESMTDGAADTTQSNIGVLLHDLYLGNALFKGASVDITELASAAHVLTITTATPHGYVVGDYAGIQFTPRLNNYGNGFGARIASVIDATHFTVLGPQTVPDQATTPTTGITGLAYDDIADDTNSDGIADDGFGDVQSVYAGATTVDGKPAFAVTWYRVMSYENLNDPTVSDTFQLVFLQEPASSLLPYPFTVYFNFGTVQDNELEDGYNSADPSVECDASAPEDCRFAVGFSYYDAVTGTATSTELFADVPKADLIDGGSQALVSHSLNSSVLGRYATSFGVAPVLAATGLTLSLPLLGGALALLVLGGAVLVTRRRASHS